MLPFLFNQGTKKPHNSLGFPAPKGVNFGESVQMTKSSRIFGCFKMIPKLAYLTSFDYLLVMISVRIADLKSRLSEHLRQVRRGESLTVLDRNTPIARVVPFEEKPGVLKSRPPLPHIPKLQRIPLPPPLRRHKDVLAYLLEERQVER